MDKETTKQIVTKIRDFLEGNNLWNSSRIYFNGDCYDSEYGIFFNIDPREHITTGKVLGYITLTAPEETMEAISVELVSIFNRRFNGVISQYGLYYERIDDRTLSIYVA